MAWPVQQTGSLLGAVVSGSADVSKPLPPPPPPPAVCKLCQPAAETGRVGVAHRRCSCSKTPRVNALLLSAALVISPFNLNWCYVFQGHGVGWEYQMLRSCREVMNYVTTL